MAPSSIFSLWPNLQLHKIVVETLCLLNVSGRSAHPLYSLFRQQESGGEATEERKPWQNSALRHEKCVYYTDAIPWYFNHWINGLLEWVLTWPLCSLYAGSCRRRTLRSVLLSFQSLTQRRSFLRPLCRVWPPHQEPSWEATAGRDATPPVRCRERER